MATSIRSCRSRVFAAEAKEAESVSENTRRMLIGRLFEIDGAECLKAREQILVLDWRTASVRVSADERNARRGASLLISDDKYDCSPRCKIMYVSVVTF